MQGSPSQQEQEPEEWSPSEEETEDELSLERDPWGNLRGTNDKKPRVRRTGRIPLNLTRSYGQRSGWGVRQGIRELLQNFADNVRENDDGTAREVEWVLETTDEGKIHTYLAFAKGKKPKPNPKTKLLNKDKSLGYIVYKEGYGGKLLLVNKNTSLPRQVWSMGHTTKGRAEHQIGGHGEGMKVGIIALLRRNFRVTYYTNKEIWDWCFDKHYTADDKFSELLTVVLSPYRPRIAKTDPHISSDVRQARITAHKDTTVLVKAPKDREFIIDFSDYLFLIKPSEEGCMNTKLGTVLITKKYRSKIFVKEMFVEDRKDRPCLYYGINFSRAALDRDRRSTMSDSEAQRTIATIWNRLIEKEQGNAVQQYLELLLEKEDHLETLEAKNCVSKTTAEKLLELLKKLHPNGFFYSSEDPDPTETIRIIRDCLQREPQVIQRRLYDIFLDFKLIISAEEERRRLFLDSPPTNHSIATPWVKHTLHAFKSLALVPKRLRKCTYEFHDVPRSVGIDILKTGNGDQAHFKLNSRLLDFEYIHEISPCDLKWSYKAGTTDEDSICDCGVNEIFDVILKESGYTPLEVKTTQGKSRNLLSYMPRHLKVKSEQSGGDMRVELSWEAIRSHQYGSGFKFMVFNRNYGDVVHNYHRYLQPKEKGENSSQSEEEPSQSQDPSDVVQTPVEASSSPQKKLKTTSKDADFIISVPSLGSPSPPPEAYRFVPIWEGYAPRDARKLEIPIKSSWIAAGDEYVILGLSEYGQVGALYSQPFTFHIPFPTPQNLTVNRDLQKLTVTWDMPEVDVKFAVTCMAGNEKIHDQPSFSGRPHSHVIPISQAQSKVDLEITLTATAMNEWRTERKLSIRSEPPPLPPPPPKEPTPPPQPRTYGRSSSGPRKWQADVSTPSKTSGTALSTPSKSAVGSVSHTPSKTPQDSPVARRKETTIIDVDSDAFSNTSSSDEAFYDVDDGGHVGGSGDDSDDSDEMAAMASTVATGEVGFEPPANNPETSPAQKSKTFSWVGKIQPGGSYHIVKDGVHFLIRVHEVHDYLSEPSVKVTVYFFLPSPKGDEWSTEKIRLRNLALFMIYHDWEKAGDISDACTWKDTEFDVVDSCLVILPRVEAEGVSAMSSSAEHLANVDTPVFIAQWGYSLDSHCISESKGFEIRSLRHRSNTIVLNSRDIAQLGTPLSVFDLDCGVGGASLGLRRAGLAVTVGLEASEMLSESWKANNSGTIFKEDLKDFLARFEDRMSKGEISAPGMLHLTLKGERSIDDPLATSDESDEATLLLNAVSFIRPPLVLINLSMPDLSLSPSKLPSFMSLFFELSKLGYEIRGRAIKYADFGLACEEERVMIFASKIGLPKLPETGGTDIVKKLRTRGFGEYYRLVGDDTEAQMSEIENSLPPPVAQAFGRSIYNHIYSVTERVNEVQKLAAPAPAPAAETPRTGRKRTTQEDVENTLNKRVRWDTN